MTLLVLEMVLMGLATLSSWISRRPLACDLLLQKLCSRCATYFCLMINPMAVRLMTKCSIEIEEIFHLLAQAIHRKMKIL